MLPGMEGLATPPRGKGDPRVAADRRAGEAARTSTSRRCRRRTGSWRSRSATTPWVSPRSATRPWSRPQFPDMVSIYRSMVTGPFPPTQSEFADEVERRVLLDVARGYAARRCGRGPPDVPLIRAAASRRAGPPRAVPGGVVGPLAGSAPGRGHAGGGRARAGGRRGALDRDGEGARLVGDQGRAPRPAGDPDLRVLRREERVPLWAVLAARSRAAAGGRPGEAPGEHHRARWRRWRSRPATSTASPSAGPSARARTSRPASGAPWRTSSSACWTASPGSQSRVRRGDTLGVGRGSRAGWERGHPDRPGANAAVYCERPQIATRGRSGQDDRAPTYSRTRLLRRRQTDGSASLTLAARTTSTAVTRRRCGRSRWCGPPARP